MADNDGRAASLTGGSSAIGLAVDESVTSVKSDLENLIDKLQERNVPIGSLTPGVYLRKGGTNAVHVQLLADMAGAVELPAILVQERGSRVIDGMHRLEAARLRGHRYINARFLDCTDDEALVLAIKSNALHGLPLSKADRIFGAKRLLAAHPDWADRAVAVMAGLSAKTIASLRNRSAEGAQPSSKRLGRDGRRRPVAAGEGRKRAAEYINSHPDAPLRQVAREAGVSLGTVHDVSARIRRAAGLEQGRGTGSAQEGHAGPAERIALRPEAEVGGFLQWMAQHAMHPDECTEFIDAIPVQWVSAVVPIADSISEEWSQLAERLRRKQEQRAERQETRARTSCHTGTFDTAAEAAPPGDSR
jgi:ParB-like chromosome segregation protein Spo0J